jgi:uncharacterized protein (TIRG00374 family)
MVSIPGRWERPLRAAKYAVAVAALAWVVTTVNWERTAATLETFSAATLAAVVAVSVVGVLARAATWHALADHFTDVEFLPVLEANLLVNFVNSLFPSRVSGRSIAPLALRRYLGVAWNEAVAVTVAHTGLFALCYGIVALLGLAVTAEAFGPGLGAVVALSTLAYLASGAVVVLTGWRMDWIDRVVVAVASGVGRLPGGERLVPALDSARETLLDRADERFRDLCRDGRQVGLFALAWVAALVVIPAVRFHLLLTAGGAGVDLLVLPLAVVVAYSVTILPLTPGGIGVAEATAVAVFVALGVPRSVAVPVVFLDRVFGVYLPSLAGWVPFVRADLRPGS